MTILLKVNAGVLEVIEKGNVISTCYFVVDETIESPPVIPITPYGKVIIIKIPSDNSIVRLTLPFRFKILHVGGSAVIEVIHIFRKDLIGLSFSGCTNLIKVPTILPSSVKHLQFCFSSCINFNQDISMWNTSNIVNMTHMFADCHKFNRDISTWNVENVEYMDNMFANCISYNQPLDNWKVFKLRTNFSMFEGAVCFNQPLHSWLIKNNNISTNTWLYNNCLSLQSVNQTTFNGLHYSNTI